LFQLSYPIGGLLFRDFSSLYCLGRSVPKPPESVGEREIIYHKDIGCDRHLSQSERLEQTGELTSNPSAAKDIGTMVDYFASHYFVWRIYREGLPVRIANDDSRSGTRDSDDLLDCFSRVGNVLKHLIGSTPIKCVVGKLQVACILHKELDRQARCLASLL